jgi:uncharacterized protein involved in exopolysaccharide biosynthesis
MIDQSVPSQEPGGPSVAPSAPMPIEPHRSPASDEIDFLELASVLLKRWRVLIGLPVLAALLTTGISFLLAPTFTATTTFVPEVGAQGRLPTGLAGLAGQFGISLGTEASQSPRFYAQVVKSRELMERVLLSRFLDPRGDPSPGDSVTLMQLLHLRGHDSADSLQRGVRKLAKLVSASVDNQTNIVRLDVDARYPPLAAAVANRFVEYLNDFNAKARQSQARERRKFVENRVTEAERALREAEEGVRVFYERNRSWQQSPQLVFEEGRLRRQVEIRQEVYLTLTREYETARIEEVNDTPVITVIDAAVPPKEKSKPKRVVLASLALVLGGMVSLVLTFLGAYVDSARRQHAESYLRFADLLGQFKGDVRTALASIFKRGQPR